MRSHWRSWFSLSRPETWSSSAFRHGATSATQAAKAFWLILHELLDQLRVLLQIGAVDDQRIAVGIEPDVLPVDEAEIAAELDHLQIVLVVEVADDVDGMALQRRDLRGRPDIDEADRSPARCPPPWRRPATSRARRRRADCRSCGRENPWRRSRHSSSASRRSGRCWRRCSSAPRRRRPCCCATSMVARSAMPNGEPPEPTFSDGDAGALADLDGEIDAGLLVPALRLGVIERRMVGGRRPVQDQIDRLARARRHRRHAEHQGQSQAEPAACKRFIASLLVAATRLVALPV